MEIDEFPVIIELSAKEFSIREHLIRKRAKNFRLRLRKTLFSERQFISNYHGLF
jgi:hypothetical protein